MAENNSAQTQRRAGRSPVQIVQRVRHVLDELGGLTVDQVVGVEADDDEWRVTVEVVEVRRVPETADILARYEVQMSKAGKFRGYHLVGRRLRSQIGDMS